MENKKRKKFVVAGLVMIFLFSIIIILITILNRRDIYDGEPILQESLPSQDSAPIDTENLNIDREGRFPIWGLSNKVSVDQIQGMIFDLNLDLSLEDEIEGSYYRWQDLEGNQFQYSLLLNKLNFSVKEGIPWEEASLTNQSFSTFMSRYFDVDWEYEITQQMEFFGGGTIFYAKRLTSNGYPIQKTPNLFQDTDHLALRNGRIVSGEIFLTHFFDTGIQLPLLTARELSSYINNPNYPKTLNVRADHIAEAIGLGDEYPYMDMEIIQLKDEVERCEATNYTVVYFYTSFEQEFLTPVYRLGMECILEYRGEEYSVPAVAYVSAVDPQYITVPE